MDFAELNTEIARLSPYAYLATVGADGKPDVTPVFPAWQDETLWIMIFASSVKARNMAVNTDVALHWQINEAGDGVELWGTAALHTDIETKRRLWTGLFTYNLDDFLPEGPESAEACFVSITPDRAALVKQFGAGGIERWRRT